MEIVLKRLYLHNWYLFYNQLINFGNCTLITGITGSGKSVINDAMIFLLTTSTSFNQASGNENKGKRTLFSYVRGFTGDNYVRNNGYVTSYIVGEFLNTKTNRKFLIMNAVSSRNPSDKTVITNRYVFYHDTKDISIEDLNLIENGLELLPAEATIKIANKKEDIKKYISPTRENYKEQLARLFGENFPIEKFINRLIKSIAYKPNVPLESFIKDQIFGEEPIEIKNVYEIIDQIDSLENTIITLKEKEEKLQPIASLISEYNEAKEQERISQIAKICAEASYLEEDIALKENELKEKSNQLIQEKETEKKLQETIEEYNNIIYSLKVQKDSADDSGRKSLEDALNKKKKELYSIPIERLKTYIHEIKKCKGISSDLDKEIDLFLNTFEYEPLYNALTALNKSLIENKSAIEAELRENKKKRQEIQEEYSLVRNMSSNANKKTLSFLEEFNEQCKKDCRPTNLYVLADVISEIDNQWQPWIETLLGPNCFILLCDSHDYHYVKNAIEKSSYKNIPLLDYTAIYGKTSVKENSLAMKIHSENQIAQDFLNYRLGKIIITDKDSIENYKNAICIEGLHYNGYSVRSLEKRNPCFGNAIEKRKNSLSSSLSIYSKMIKEKESKQKSIDLQYNLLSNVLIRKEDALFFMNAFSEEDKCKEDIRKIQKEIDSLTMNQTLISIMESLSLKEKEKQEITEKKDAINHIIRTLEENINQINKEIPLLKKKLEEAYSLLNKHSIDDQLQAKEMLMSKTGFLTRNIFWEKYTNKVLDLQREINNKLTLFNAFYPEEDKGTDVSSYPLYVERRKKYLQNILQKL